MPCRSRCANHQASFGSVLWPLRAFTSCGFARATWTAPSKTLYTGFQYEPVLSTITCVQPSCRTQARSCFNSSIVVPDCRRSQRASPSAGPTITHTARNVFPTSIPAQRSITALIIVASLLREPDPRLRQDLLPRAYAPIGDPCTRVRPVSFTSCHQYPNRPRSRNISILAHISIFGGGANSVMAVRLVLFLRLPRAWVQAGRL